MARIFAYLDPWSADHALGKSYQLSHSLIAFGRGEMFGVGLGEMPLKNKIICRKLTRTLFWPLSGEELGFVGVLVVLALFPLAR